MFGPPGVNIRTRQAMFRDGIPSKSKGSLPEMKLIYSELQAFGQTGHAKQLAGSVCICRQPTHILRLSEIGLKRRPHVLQTTGSKHQGALPQRPANPKRPQSMPIHSPYPLPLNPYNWPLASKYSQRHPPSNGTGEKQPQILVLIQKP